MLLRRRKKTFKEWIAEAGISSYNEVVRWCDRIGAIPPKQEEFDALMPRIVTAPSDGIIVFEVGPMNEVIDPAPEMEDILDRAQKKKRRQPPAVSVVTDRQD
jgi:hypothetical protein